MRAEIALREPDGVDDMLLHETPGAEAAGLGLLARVGGGAVDWPGLVVTDFEFLLLALRVARFGPAMALGFACPACGAMAELGFRVGDLLASVAPRPAQGVTAYAGRPGWFRVGPASFRLPTVGDVVAAMRTGRPAAALAGLCLDETARGRAHRGLVERAMGVMAPVYSRVVAGACPACGAAVRAALSVAHVVVAEFRRAARFVVDEVDLIARAYHWPEPAILALPQARRRAYAERIRLAGGG
jgi:predicted RNA-binding Zn-ribbon protein involved in translation (DUF1610 family)